MKVLSPLRSCALAAVLATSALHATAASPAVVYDFGGTPTSLAPTSAVAGLTATGMSFGGGAVDGAGIAPGALNFSSGNDNGYLEFGVTVLAGQQFDADSLSVRAAALLIGSGIQLRSSVDSFASNLLNTTLGTGYPNFQDYTAFLGSLAVFQDLTGTTTFRLYGVSGFGGAELAIDSMTLAGTVSPIVAPVPEPQAYALMLTSLVVLGAVARRRNNRAA
jgi:hypothetical protein